MKEKPYRNFDNISASYNFDSKFSAEDSTFFLIYLMLNRCKQEGCAAGTSADYDPDSFVGTLSDPQHLSLADLTTIPLDQLRRYFQNSRAENAQSFQNGIRDLADGVEAMLSRRTESVFLTENGRLGVAHTSIYEGDSILLIPRTNNPFVSGRPGSGTYLLVALAFVYGL
ncbi:hypothetical protein BDY21DRAFT_345814, partial [Lineolata rhizophorae]